MLNESKSKSIRPGYASYENYCTRPVCFIITTILLYIQLLYYIFIIFRRRRRRRRRRRHRLFVKHTTMQVVDMGYFPIHTHTLSLSPSFYPSQPPSFPFLFPSLYSAQFPLRLCSLSGHLYIPLANAIKHIFIFFACHSLWLFRASLVLLCSSATTIAGTGFAFDYNLQVLIGVFSPLSSSSFYNIASLVC